MWKLLSLWWLGTGKIDTTTVDPYVVHGGVSLGSGAIR